MAQAGDGCSQALVYQREALKMGPLDGVKVFDLSRILAGPTCTQLLGDLGADIIKVERPGVGDDTRRWGPPYLKDDAGKDTAESGYYLASNRNKRSIALDLSSARGQEIARRIATQCDIVIENYKVGDMARYGLSYPDLVKSNPALIYCSISGFGQTGPYAARAGYDLLAQGIGGIMSVTGEPDRPPMKVGVGVADLMCGMYAAVAILAALRSRDQTGRGQCIDLSLLDTQVAWLINLALNYFLSGEVPGRMGNEHPNIAPYKVFRCSDGYVILAVGNDSQFARFCSFAGQAALASDVRFETNAARLTHREALNAWIAERMAARTCREWVEGLAGLGVPCSPVNDIAEVFADPQVIHRGMRVSMPHPSAGSGRVDLLANPIRFSETPVEYRLHPPLLGEHTEEILREFGIDPADESITNSGSETSTSSDHPTS
jgi:crotonobetainyl-CoA:carnitine CoA-transferase CaiB-like acyl-CoA transferase